MVNWLCIKIAGEVNKKFTVKTKAKQVVLKVVVIDKVDKIDKSNGVNKYKRIVLS